MQYNLGIESKHISTIGNTLKKLVKKGKTTVAKDAEIETRDQSTKIALATEATKMDGTKGSASSGKIAEEGIFAL